MSDNVRYAWIKGLDRQGRPAQAAIAISPMRFEPIPIPKLLMLLAIAATVLFVRNFDTRQADTNPHYSTGNTKLETFQKIQRGE